MNELKVCTRCGEEKDASKDFYFCSGQRRSECKKCTIKRNVGYQKKAQTWKYRCVEGDDRRPYMREYYSKNKEKFTEYRSKFREKNPEYYREYYRNKKDKDGT